MPNKISSLLTINNLTVCTQNKTILNNINLKVYRGEIVTIFGPNGSGKTVLLKSIMNVGNYHPSAGQIIFQNKDLTSLPANRRAQLGLSLLFQKPPKIAGVKLQDLLALLEPNRSKTTRLTKTLKLQKLTAREINGNFSGGEIKRSELLQLALQNGKLFLLDEPDSGVDLENIKLIAQQIKNLLKNGKSALLITHTGEILKHLSSQRAYVLVNGSIRCEGNTQKIFRIIKKSGYSKCLKCKKNPLLTG